MPLLLKVERQRNRGNKGRNIKVRGKELRRNALRYIHALSLLFASHSIFFFKRIFSLPFRFPLSLLEKVSTPSGLSAWGG